ncbi:endonuclease MutS2 [Helicobacter ailurogastricus]|uniref:endonuclease MutS2 n=1 Tax=Helicobacter ailurogastricus TaxID=1578720 RepID=UPI00244D82DB|nr:Smr/MutS family protein [Helicobacter ailurogastricus]GMB91506.1 Recombination and DNA strand exchange inhibitor protein MutS [Helicobacter ailurogastricus]
MIAVKLDLAPFLERFVSFLARPKDIAFNFPEQTWVHLQELESLEIATPPLVAPLNESLKAFKKGGVLHLEALFALIQITRYFLYLKKQVSPKSPAFYAYLQNLNIPQELLQLEAQMQEEAGFKSGFYPELDAQQESLKRLKSAQQKIFSQILAQKSLEPYLVDRQVHLVQGVETLLLKPGFSSVFKGIVIARSHSGQFYIEPLEAKTLNHKIQETRAQIEHCLQQICAQWSVKLRPLFLFLRFFDRQFDYLDHLQGRINFAKSGGLNFVKPNTSGQFVLKDFAHPSLKEPKPLSVDFNHALLLVTGVNTGGKTMLLKSLLASVWLAKHFLPFKINPHHSKIPYIENIQAIISDPQNSQNDISTFAGRMLDFSHALKTPNLLLGVDEIELGTDAAEASCLYKALLEKLINQGAKVVVTTHHKHLALLLARNRAVQLLAANYDHQAQMPTYTFTPGLIGKSYAFETALRYGVPADLIAQAKELYGADQENLNALIERTSALEQELQQQQNQLKEAQEAQEKAYQEKLSQIQETQKAKEAQQSVLEQSYSKALKQMQEALREFNRTQNQSLAHQQIQAIQAGLKRPKEQTPPKENKTLEVGDFVGYGKLSGEIVAISAGLYSVALENGLKIKVKAESLRPKQKPQAPRAEVQIKHKPQAKGQMRLDLCGLDTQEALEQAQDFLANALLAGFEEVLIVHGKGKGILRNALREWLKIHPKVLEFGDAPYNLGGSGAQVVKI